MTVEGSCTITSSEYKDLQRHCRFLWYRFKLMDRCEAEDLVNDAAERFCNAIAKGTKVRKRLPFMKRLAYRSAVALFREGVIEFEASYDPVILEQFDGLASNPNSLKMLYRAELLEKAVSILTEEEQELFTLRITQDLAWSDACKVLHEKGENTSISSLRQKWCRIKAKIAKYLFQEGLDSFE